MYLRPATAVARVVLLALVFRIGLGFGHGPVVSELPDSLTHTFCGPLPLSELPGATYQGCPICHALAWGADLGHGVTPVSAFLRLDLVQQLEPPFRERSLADSGNQRDYHPRAPPGPAAV